VKVDGDGATGDGAMGDGAMEYNNNDDCNG